MKGKVCCRDIYVDDLRGGLVGEAGREDTGGAHISMRLLGTEQMGVVSIKNSMTMSHRACRTAAISFSLSTLTSQLPHSQMRNWINAVGPTTNSVQYTITSFLTK